MKYLQAFVDYLYFNNYSLMMRIKPLFGSKNPTWVKDDTVVFACFFWVAWSLPFSVLLLELSPISLDEHLWIYCGGLAVLYIIVCYLGNKYYSEERQNLIIEKYSQRRTNAVVEILITLAYIAFTSGYIYIVGGFVYRLCQKL